MNKYLYAPVISTLSVLLLLMLESFFYRGVFISLMVFASFILWTILISPAITITKKRYLLFIVFILLSFLQSYCYIALVWIPGSSYIEIGGEILVKDSIAYPQYYQEIIQGVIMYNLALLISYPIFYWILYHKKNNTN